MNQPYKRLSLIFFQIASASNKVGKFFDGKFMDAGHVFADPWYFGRMLPKVKRKALILQHQLEAGANAIIHYSFQIGVSLKDLKKLLDLVISMVFDHGQENILFAFEMKIQRPFGYPRLRRNIFRGGPIKPFSGKYFGGRFNQLRLPCFCRKFGTLLQKHSPL